MRSHEVEEEKFCKVLLGVTCQVDHFGSLEEDISAFINLIF